MFQASSLRWPTVTVAFDAVGTGPLLYQLQRLFNIRRLTIIMPHRSVSMRVSVMFLYQSSKARIPRHRHPREDPRKDRHVGEDVGVGVVEYGLY